MASKFVYSEQIPEEVKPAIKEILDKYECLVPSWVNYVNVSWSAVPRERNASAESMGDYAYRWATIFICPLFLDESPTEREDTIIHELVHVVLFPLTNYYAQIIGSLDEQPEKVQNFMDIQLSEKIEAVTVDTTACLLRLIKGPDYLHIARKSPSTPAKKGIVETENKEVT
jgi:hypothetical protein